MGRPVRKRGKISYHLLPILNRLKIDADNYVRFIRREPKRIEGRLTAEPAPNGQVIASRAIRRRSVLGAVVDLDVPAGQVLPDEGARATVDVEAQQRVVLRLTVVLEHGVDRAVLRPGAVVDADPSRRDHRGRGGAGSRPKS